MRAMWCTLIALCLVAAGAQPHRAHRSSDVTAALRVAHSAASASARRASSPDLGPFVIADVATSIAPDRQAVLGDIPAPAPAPGTVRPSSRSSRGPPHV